jgi:hypothetical protein
MAISTIRCTLTYLVFPFVLPALGWSRTRAWCSAPSSVSSRSPAT